MKKMVGLKYSQVTISKRNNIKSLTSIQNTVHTNGTHTLNVDVNLLFQRLLATMDYQNDDAAKRAFSHELAPYSLSLFDEDDLMRKCVKSEVYKLLSSTLHSPTTLQSFKYVVDGGFLL